MNKKNIIYLVLDSLRPDRLGYMGHQPSPSYNLDNIANSSTRCTNTFTGGNPTEFSLPYLLTSSYLLDHGGYANGIEHRPITLAEVLSNNGYRTAYISGLYERSSGAYARGFDDVYKIYDFNKLPVDIENTLPHYRKLNKDNKISSIECIEELTPYFEAWFNDVIEHCKDLSNLLSEKELPSSLIFENYNFIEIIKETEYEFNKFKQQPDQYILNVLSGKEFGLVKIINKFVTNRQNKSPFDLIELRSRMVFLRYLVHSFIFSTSYKSAKEALALGLFRAKDGQQKWVKYPSAGYHLQTFKKWVNRLGHEKPFFAYIQAIDIHEANLFSYDLTDQNKVKRNEINNSYKYLKSIAKNKKLNYGNIFYDCGIRYVDDQVGQLYQFLEENGLRENTLVVITADHGHQYPNIPVRDNVNQGHHFFDELYRIPLIIDNNDLKPKQYDGFVSSIDIAPTILSMVGIDAPSSFMGNIIDFDNKLQREYVTMENQGLGPCDILRKPICVCVRSNGYKIVYVSPPISGDSQDYISEIYDLQKDLNQYNNLANDDSVIKNVTPLIAIAKNRIKEVRKSL